MLLAAAKKSCRCSFSLSFPHLFFLYAAHWRAEPWAIDGDRWSLDTQRSRDICTSLPRIQIDCKWGCSVERDAIQHVRDHIQATRTYVEGTIYSKMRWSIQQSHVSSPEHGHWKDSGTLRRSIRQRNASETTSAQLRHVWPKPLCFGLMSIYIQRKHSYS